MWLFALGFICSIFGLSLQQHCSGVCGSHISLNVTLPDSVIIPCGDIQLSNNSTVDYCNATDGINEPLELGATMQYNLTTTKITHLNNIIYCTDNQNIYCYSLNVFFAPFVPSSFVPSVVSREDADTVVVLICPFKYTGNPPAVCTWCRFDNDNISHELTMQISDPSNCVVQFYFSENDNGLYQCTGHNLVGNTTYTFPERFIVETCSVYASITPVLVVSQTPTVNAQENATIVCTASAVTRNTSLAWMVDGALYNSTSVYNSPRGQVMVELSTFNNKSCRLSLSLTVLNAQSNSQGVYTCVLQYNNFTISKSTSLMYVEDSTTGSSSTLAPIVGGTLAGVVVFLSILTALIVLGALYYRKNQSTHQPLTYSNPMTHS